MSLAPFLPRHLRHSIRRKWRKPPAVERFKAALLLSDINGFTKLTERLQQRGREGAEEVARIVGQAFDPAIAAIGQAGGSIACFGGDALFSLFLGPDGVTAAARAARRIRRLFRQRSRSRSSRDVALQISQAIHYGDVEGIHLGNRQKRHYLVVGEAVEETVVLEARSEDGAIVLSGAARDRLGHERSREDVAREEGAHGVASELVEKRFRLYVPRPLLPLLDDFEGEYRQAAILFLETRERRARKLQSFFRDLSRLLDRYGGTLLKSDVSEAGTKWLVLFGVPQRHEDDAGRAAHTAIEMRRSAAESDIELRQGLDAGILANIVIGSADRRSFDMMGDAVNLAARCLDKAAFGEIVATDRLRALLPEVVTEPLGRHSVKGKAEPLLLHALTATGSATRRLRLSVPLVGRERELGRLRAALDQAADGRGTTVCLLGAAGTGKSRLLFESARMAKERGFTVHRGHSSSLGLRPYDAFANLLHDCLGLLRGASSDEILDRVAQTTLEVNATDRHHLADLLGARFPDSPLDHLTGKEIRLNNRIAIRKFLFALSTRSPCLFILDDLHHADEATRNAIAFLAEAVESSESCKILLLLAARSDYGPPARSVRIEIGDLESGAIRRMLAELMGSVPPSIFRTVKERCGGNPLAIEEVVNHFLELGILAFSDSGYRLARNPTPEEVPRGLEAVIAARLDRLSRHARQVVQAASVLGVRFRRDLLARMVRPSEGDQDVLRSAIRELVERSLFVIEDDLARFRQSTIRDVAYATVLKRTRRTLHGRAASAMEELPAREREELLAPLADHWNAAANSEKARRYYLPAARQAAKSYQLIEAERLYRAYLDLARQPCRSVIDARNELGRDVLRLLGRRREALEQHKRASALAESISDHDAWLGSVNALSATYRLLGEPRKARQTAEQALARAGEDAGEGKADLLNSLANLRREEGKYADAEVLYDRALALHRRFRSLRGQGVVLGNRGLCLENQGRFQEAARNYLSSLAIAKKSGNKRGEAVVLGNLANLYFEQRLFGEARRYYKKALALRRKLGDLPGEGHVLGNLANLLMDQGEMLSAMRLCRRSIAIAREVEERRGEAFQLGNLAVLLHAAGRLDQALTVSREALAIHRDLGNLKSEASILANVGALYTEMGSEEEARRSFEESLVVARKLRHPRLLAVASLNLAVFHLNRGHLEEARRMLLQASRPDETEGSRHVRGNRLHVLATLERLMTGDLQRARNLAEEAGTLLSLDKRTNEIILNHCELGFIALAAGDEAAPFLAAAREQMEQAGHALPEARAEIDRLARAIAAASASQPLVCGEIEMPEPRLRWLRRHRPEAVPTEYRKDGKGPSLA